MQISQYYKRLVPLVPGPRGDTTAIYAVTAQHQMRLFETSLVQIGI